MSAADDLSLPNTGDLDWDIQLGQAIQGLAREIDRKQNNREDFQTVPVDSTLDLDLNYDIFKIVGEGIIYAINPTGRRGRTVTLYFPEEAQVVVSENENIVLTTSFTSEKDSALTLFSDGVVFREQSRSNPAVTNGQPPELPGDSSVVQLTPDPEYPGFFFITIGQEAPQ